MLPCKRIFVWLILFCLTASAQHPLVINYGKKEGLPSFEAYDIIQDSEGFLWIPTDCGVVKYDGYQFKTFNTESGLKNNCVFKVYEDHKKRKWLITSTNEICYIENDKVVYVPCSDEFSKLAGPFSAKRLIVDKYDNLFLSYRGVPWFYKIKPPYNNLGNSKVFLDQTVYYGYIEEIGNNYLYGTNGTYPFESIRGGMQIKRGKKVHTIPGKIEFSTQIFSTPAGDGSYFFSEGKLLFKIAKDTSYLVKKFESNIISINVINSDVWIGFYQGGVSKFDLKDFKFVSTVLPEYSVTGCIFDSEKNLWISTLEGGVFTIPQLGTSFLNESNGLTNENIISSCVYKGKLTVGGYDGIISIIDKQKVAEQIKLEQARSFSNYVTLEYKDMLLWGGGNGAYLLKNGKVVSQIVTGMIRSASIAKDGIYMGSVNDLWYYDGNKTKEIGEINSRLTRVLCDRSGNVWLGTNKGFMYLKGNQIEEHKAFKNYFNGKVTDIKEAHDSSIWVGTNGKGLLIIKDDSIRHFSELKKDNIISYIYSDPVSNKLWVSTSQAVYLIDPVKLTKTKIFTLKQYSFDITSIARVDETLYLTTTKGIFMVDVKELMQEQKFPSLYLSSIEAGEQKYTPGDKLSLPYSDARIKFTFKSITFMGIPPETYRYKLEGGDNRWHVTENNSVEYGFLKPGKYKFTVVSYDESGKVSPNTADFSFTIQAPFYLKSWFLITLAFLIAAILGFFAMLLIKYIRKKEKLRNDNEVKLADLELKALRSQMNPHFIFNSLNAVQGLILRNDSEGALTFMGKFSRLVRGVLENSEKPLIPLSEEVASLNLYLQLEQLKYDHIFNYSIVVDEDIIPNQLFLPSMLIQPLVENAIQHGVVKSDRKGNIKVSFKLESESRLLVVVEDNGVGFSVKKQKRAEERISLGMKVTNERLKLLEKRMFKGNDNSSAISVNSVLGGGTAVYLKIPVYGKTNVTGYNSR